MEVDLLPPGKLQQQVEGSLETVDIDQESGFAIGALDAVGLLKR